MLCLLELMFLYYLYCLSFLLIGAVPEIISLGIIINARHVHFKDTRINLIMYGNFFLLIVIIYKCKLASI